jgi:hypothetical protein
VEHVVGQDRHEEKCQYLGLGEFQPETLHHTADNMMSHFDHPMSVMSIGGNWPKVDIIMVAQVLKDTSGKFTAQVSDENTGRAMDTQPRFQKTRRRRLPWPIGQNRAGTEPGKGIGKVTNGVFLEKEKIHPKGGVKFRITRNGTNWFVGGFSQISPNGTVVGNVLTHFNQRGGYPSPLKKTTKKIGFREAHLEKNFHQGLVSCGRGQSRFGQEEFDANCVLLRRGGGVNRNGGFEGGFGKWFSRHELGGVIVL